MVAWGLTLTFLTQPLYIQVNSSQKCPVFQTFCLYYFQNDCDIYLLFSFTVLLTTLNNPADDATRVHCVMFCFRNRNYTFLNLTAGARYNITVDLVMGCEKLTSYTLVQTGKLKLNFLKSGVICEDNFAGWFIFFLPVLH